jgi:hypothetical protein
VYSEDHSIGVRERDQIHILGGEGYGNVIPLSLSDGAFDSYMIYFSVIISVLSFDVEIGIGAPGDYKDCAVSWENFILLLHLLNLWQRWRWWVRFGFNLRGVLLGVG